MIIITVARGIGRGAQGPNHRHQVIAKPIQLIQHAVARIASTIHITARLLIPWRLLITLATGHAAFCAVRSFPWLPSIEGHAGRPACRDDRFW
jgi:hypothetical protein